jgi:hypothetical protein
MMDLETLGTEPGCIVLSIGAVMFDPDLGLGADFYAAIEKEDCERYGLKFSPRTDQWWERQSSDAKKAAFTGGTTLRSALAAFDRFYIDNAGTHLWGHGASFDAPVLQAAYRALGWEEPWQYNATRCTRTLYELAGVEPDRSKGTHHNALDDARNQAEAAIAAMRLLRQRLGTNLIEGAGQ